MIITLEATTTVASTAVSILVYNVFIVTPLGNCGWRGRYIQVRTCTEYIGCMYTCNADSCTHACI